MLSVYRADRTSIERSYASNSGMPPTNQVVASSPKKVPKIFMGHVTDELNRLEGERERMAEIVRRQAQELAQLKESLDEKTD